MNLCTILVLSFCLCIFGCMTEQPTLPLSSGWQLQDAARCQASGSLISQTGYDTPEWRCATVPGTVLTSLVNDGVYPEPLYGENNRPNHSRKPQPHDLLVSNQIRRARRFRRQTNLAQFRRHQLHRRDLGQRPGRRHHPRRVFTRRLLDVTDWVQPGQPAAVAVHIVRRPIPGIAEKTQAAGTGPDGGILAIDGPTFLCSIGWDWIPTIRDRNIGIWQKVWLSTTGPVAIADPLVSSDLPLPKLDVADLNISATVSQRHRRAGYGKTCRQRRRPCLQPIRRLAAHRIPRDSVSLAENQQSRLCTAASI